MTPTGHPLNGATRPRRIPEALGVGATAMQPRSLEPLLVERISNERKRDHYTSERKRAVDQDAV